MLILAFRDIGFCCFFRWMNWWDRNWLIGSWLWIKKKAERSRVLQKYSKSLLFTWIYWITSETLTLYTLCVLLHIVNEEIENFVFMHILFLTTQKKKASKSGKKKKKDKDLTVDRFFLIIVFLTCLWKFGMVKGIVHIFNYSLSLCFTPVWLSFFHGNQKEKFLIIVLDVFSMQLQLIMTKAFKLQKTRTQMLN